jgi:glycosyltransferase involved in cell wall biosynthesis
VAKGIGGSEEAVIHLAPKLAARGHDVSVVHRLEGVSQRFSGVTWCSYESRSPKQADIGIFWRRARLIDRTGVDAARHSYLWLHDLCSEKEIAARLNDYRKVMVLSRFHRTRYPSIPSSRVFITANGIEPAEFEAHDPKSVERDSTLMVYGSSYNRGLRMLLTVWPRIRREIPGARLHVFYGWQTMRRMNPARFEALRDVFERLMRHDGITHLDRLSHEDVAREYSRAGVWAYPCSFPETSCISAMKAQAGGAIPVVIPTGALNETVRFGFKTMRSHTDYPGMPLPERIVEEWLSGLFGLLRKPRDQTDIRAEMIPASRRLFSWSNIAESWEREFEAELRAEDHASCNLLADRESYASA